MQHLVVVSDWFGICVLISPISPGCFSCCWGWAVGQEWTAEEERSAEGYSWSICGQVWCLYSPEFEMNLLSFWLCTGQCSTLSMCYQLQAGILYDTHHQMSLLFSKVNSHIWVLKSNNLTYLFSKRNKQSSSNSWTHLMFHISMFAFVRYVKMMWSHLKIKCSLDANFNAGWTSPIDTEIPKYLYSKYLLLLELVCRIRWTVCSSQVIVS
jgi:hypothetical protein